MMDIHWESKTVKGKTGFEYVAWTYHKGQIVITAMHVLDAVSSVPDAAVYREMVYALEKAIRDYDAKDNTNNPTNG